MLEDARIHPRDNAGKLPAGAWHVVLLKGGIHRQTVGGSATMASWNACRFLSDRQTGSLRTPEKQPQSPVRGVTRSELGPASPLLRRVRSRIGDSPAVSRSEASLEIRTIAAWHVSGSTRGDAQELQAVAARKKDAVRFVSE